MNCAPTSAFLRFSAEPNPLAGSPQGASATRPYDMVRCPIGVVALWAGRMRFAPTSTLLVPVRAVASQYGERQRKVGRESTPQMNGSEGRHPTAMRGRAIIAWAAMGLLCSPLAALVGLTDVAGSSVVLARFTPSFAGCTTLLLLAAGLCICLAVLPRGQQTNYPNVVLTLCLTGMVLWAVVIVGFLVLQLAGSGLLSSSHR